MTIVIDWDVKQQIKPISRLTAFVAAYHLAAAFYHQKYFAPYQNIPVFFKVADETALVDLTAPVAGVILTLLANLRQCFISEDTETSEKDRRDSQYVTLLDKTQAGGQSVSWGQGTGSRTQFATSLQMVLKGLIEHIMRSS